MEAVVEDSSCTNFFPLNIPKPHLLTHSAWVFMVFSPPFLNPPFCSSWRAVISVSVFFSSLPYFRDDVPHSLDERTFFQSSPPSSRSPTRSPLEFITLPFGVLAPAFNLLQPGYSSSSFAVLLPWGVRSSYRVASGARDSSLGLSPALTFVLRQRPRSVDHS